MRAILESRYARVAAFIDLYGHTRSWTVEELAMCAILRLTDGDNTAGYVWLHFSPDDPFRLHIHASISPSWHGRAFSHQIASDVCALARLMGAESLVGTYADERQARLWRRFFSRFVPATQDGCDVYYRVDTPNGLLVSLGAAGPAEASAGAGRVSQGPND